MKSLFYLPEIPGEFVELEEQESKHALRVLRLRTGDPVQLVDGAGGMYQGVITGEHPRRCTIRITSHVPDYHPLPYHLHLAVSPTKSTDRFEWFLEKATEIGISEITPLICHRSERTRINPERLDRILVSAMKQSLRAFKPVLHSPERYDTFVSLPREGTRGIAHCISEAEGELAERSGIKDLAVSSGTKAQALRSGIKAQSGNKNFTLLVGPEGDFTEEEVMKALAAGYVPFHLGEARMRTETAGVYICAAIHLLSEDQ